MKKSLFLVAAAIIAVLLSTKTFAGGNNPPGKEKVALVAPEKSTFDHLSINPVCKLECYDATGAFIPIASCQFDEMKFEETKSYLPVHSVSPFLVCSKSAALPGRSGPMHKNLSFIKLPKKTELIPAEPPTQRPVVNAREWKDVHRRR